MNMTCRLAFSQNVITNTIGLKHDSMLRPQYTPITKGSEAIFDCSAYYKIKLDDSFLDYLAGSNVQVFYLLLKNEAALDKSEALLLLSSN